MVKARRRISKYKAKIPKLYSNLLPGKTYIRAGILLDNEFKMRKIIDTQNPSSTYANPALIIKIESGGLF